jgi:hypothetical protein
MNVKSSQCCRQKQSPSILKKQPSNRRKQCQAFIKYTRGQGLLQPLENRRGIHVYPHTRLPESFD